LSARALAKADDVQWANRIINQSASAKASADKTKGK
jgi:hypothetical protein